ncbi:protein phosphatase regulator [Ceratocystis pirilliformis]|uniref:Protein phosphatase regulator n=1 Tax=Ceratocystis pirilliformis TaxID=259994 RepID=A0ABR3ZNU7_9PEZI
MATVHPVHQNNMFPSTSGDGLRRSLSQPKFALEAGLKRSGSSSRLHNSASTSQLGGYFSDAFTTTATTTAVAITASSDTMAASTPIVTPGPPTPVSAYTHSVFATSLSSGTNPPSIDSESSSSMSLDFDYDGSINGDYAHVGNYTLPAHYHQYYSTEALESPLGHKNPSSYTASPTTSYSPERDNSVITSRPQSPVIFNSEDDTAVRAVPSRHVDYLSHDWREEDIWSSWKYVVSRRGEFTNSARLENASWRTWMKSKNKLKTVSPETLNWLKESDVTWLYGPLQVGSTPNGGTTSSNDPPSAASTTKPILKKRSKSEAMLQRSLSTSSLVKQATAAIQAQETHLRNRRPVVQSITSTALFSGRRRVSTDCSPGYPTSLVPSGIVSPSEQKRIHFNEQVIQCIAVDVKGPDEDDEPAFSQTLSDDEDGILLIRTRIRRRVPLLRHKSAPAKTSFNKTIAMLPSTTLKCEHDAPQFETAMKHSFRSPIVSPSLSQENFSSSTTLQHAKKSHRVFGSEDGDDDLDDQIEIEQQEDIGVSFASHGRSLARSSTPAPSRGFAFGDDDEDEDEADQGDDDEFFMRSSRLGSIGGGSSSSGLGGLKRSTSTNSLSESGNARSSSLGMNTIIPSHMETSYPLSSSNTTRTPPSPPGDGFAGQLIDFIDTARDIAHVIWNVGWQR